MENASSSSKEGQGRRLKQARALRFDTAREAAEALGVNEQTYMPWESGRTGFTHHVARLAIFFGVNERWLLTGAGPMKRGEQHRAAALFERIPPEKQPYVLEMLEMYASRKG